MSPRARRRTLVRTSLAILAVGLLAVVVAGCGLGAGSGSTEARLLVTQDFGAKVIGARIVQDAPSSDTVMRLLARNFTVKTRYGGGFVESIDGLAGGTANGRKVDWLFYVNGIQSDKGAAEVKLHAGDQIWWDRHDWGATQTVPAVVGSFPEPFVHGSGGRRWPVLLECDDPNGAACNEVSDRLSAVGVIANKQVIGTGVGRDTMRIFVGPWQRLRSDVVLRQIDRGPAYGGVYARFDQNGTRLSLLDGQGRVARTLGAGAGLVAATRFQDQAPTWAITGTDVAGVESAAKALTAPQLRDHFALAIDGGRPTSVPLVG
ncbi:MAG: hypothetical protein JWQ48_3653 [Conexibacter sp.]|nr:hypothetical protein [Conexibacter sp.]